jgi:hypothetical protein
LQIGYTSGTRSNQSLGWARKKLPPDCVDDLNYESALVFAMFWNMCWTRLSMEVLDNFDNFLEETEIPRLNPDGSKDISGTYTISNSQVRHTFYGMKMPPPCGYFGVNYFRYVYFHCTSIKYLQWSIDAHHERCHHFFSVLWTTRKEHHPEKTMVGISTSATMELR